MRPDSWHNLYSLWPYTHHITNVNLSSVHHPFSLHIFYLLHVRKLLKKSPLITFVPRNHTCSFLREFTVPSNRFNRNLTQDWLLNRNGSVFRSPSFLSCLSPLPRISHFLTLSCRSLTFTKVYRFRVTLRLRNRLQLNFLHPTSV